MSADGSRGQKLLTAERLEELFQRGEALRHRLNEVAKVRGVPIPMQGYEHTEVGKIRRETLGPAEAPVWDARSGER